MFGNRKNMNDIFRVLDEMFAHFNPIGPFETTENGNWKSQTKLSEDGTYKITSYYYVNSKDENSRLNNLRRELETAIENEDFEKAVELRDKIKNLESNQKEIESLELELKKSIEAQDFEKSIEIRDRLKKLK